MSANAYDNSISSSVDLVTAAAKCLEKEDWRGVKFYTKKCISLYKGHAVGMQKRLKDFPSLEAAPSYWALNDVAYSYFLQGEMYRLTGNFESAKRQYTTVIKRLKFAQVYDPALGKDWKVAKACIKKLNEMKKEEKKTGKGNKFIKKKLKPLK